MTEELIGLFDTHAHPTDERFNEDREQVLARMREAALKIRYPFCLQSKTP